MPELPEVETVAQGLHRHLAGRVIESVRLLRADIAHGHGRPCDALLRGRRISAVARVGKQIQISFDGNAALTIRVHLGMTGRLIVTSPDQPLAKHTHLQIGFKGGRFELRFCDPRRFGGVWIIDPDHSDGNGWIGRRLPPIAADPLWISLEEWRTLLARRRQIKALLLDQRPISGVGNIYCDEALYRAGIHPQTIASDLKPQTVRRLYLALRRILNEAIAAGGSSVSDYRDADDATGSFQNRHRVYGREGRPCPRCHTSIRRLTVAGRGTHICPRCQKLALAKRNLNR